MFVIAVEQSLEKTRYFLSNGFDQNMYIYFNAAGEPIKNSGTFKGDSPEESALIEAVNSHLKEDYKIYCRGAI